MKRTWGKQSGGLDLSLEKTPVFLVKAVVELASLPKDIMIERSGNGKVVVELATDFGFTDADKNCPPLI